MRYFQAEAEMNTAKHVCETARKVEKDKISDSKGSLSGQDKARLYLNIERKVNMMTVKELYRLVEDFFGYKCHMRGYNPEKKEVFCILYDSFWFECDLNDRYGRFGAAIRIGEGEIITNFLGESCSLNSDEKSIKESLKIVDNYCRLRLPDKFLEAYYKAYVTSLYEDVDSGKWLKQFIRRKKDR